MALGDVILEMAVWARKAAVLVFAASVTAETSFVVPICRQIRTALWNDCSRSSRHHRDVKPVGRHIRLGSQYRRSSKFAMTHESDRDPVENGLKSTDPPIPVSPVPSPAPLSDLPPLMSTSQTLERTVTRRLAIATLFSIPVALGGNLFSVTSLLLSWLPENLVMQTRLDTYFPRGSFKRYISDQYAYTLVYPKEWVADTAVELAKIQRRTKTLEYSMASARRADSLVPDAAFGPPGRLNERGVSVSDTNVSVVVSKVMPGFSLRGTLGSPQAAAEALLTKSIAPEGSGRLATLVDASEEQRGMSNVYQFQYNIDRSGLLGSSSAAGNYSTLLRSISVIAERNGDTLVTLTAVAPAEDWTDPKYEAKLQKIASSFQLIG